MRGGTEVEHQSGNGEGGRSPSLVARASSPQGRGEDKDIAIIGAGIVGICAATYLAEAGHRVTVYDRTGICEETSSGNAAAFAFSDVLPLAQKGMLKNLPKWLSDPLGPLSIPPAYLPSLLPWLWRFWRAGSPDRYEASLAAQGALMGLAETEWMGLMDRSGTRGMLREGGSLELYESEEEFRASLPGWAARDRFGIAYRHVDGQALADLQPGLSTTFIKGTFVPGWKTVSDPKDLGKAIWSYAESKGAKFRQCTVTALERRDQRTFAWVRGADQVDAEIFVLAAGAWSNLITVPRLNEHFPLETERGYNTTLPAGAFDVKRQLIFSGHGFVVTPLDGGLRVGGAVELGGLKLPPNYARSRALLEKARRFLPGLKTEGGREWMGYRPSLPDSMPVIGRSAKAPNLFYAFGHGHLGLTQSAATGRLIRDLVCDQVPPIDLTPFSPNRF